MFLFCSSLRLNKKNKRGTKYGLLRENGSF